MVTRILSVMGICLGLAALQAAGAWDVHQNNVPDVEKADHMHGGLPTCFMAAASNQLAAGGWGQGATAQARADSIYNDMTAHYGTANGGWCDIAAGWWLWAIGMNPASPPPQMPFSMNFKVYNASDYAKQGARPNNWPAGGAQYGNYNGLLNDLNAGSYVNIGIRPDATGEDGHCVTLVGGDYYGNDGTARGQAVIHDNEGDLSPPDGNDDAYDNVGTPTWTTSYNTAWKCYSASVLAPGAMQGPWNTPGYWFGWYGDGTRQTSFAPQWQVYDGGETYMSPYWRTSHTSAVVFTSAGSPAPKDVYVTVDFAIDQGATPDIRMLDQTGNPADLVGVEWFGSDYARYHFRFDGVPVFEEILFPTPEYYDLTGAVFNWSASNVPEPATLSLLALGGLAMLRRRHAA